MKKTKAGKVYNLTDGKPYIVTLKGREMAWMEQQKALYSIPHQRLLEDSVKQRLDREAKKVAAK